jgi:hypothetical protein
MCEQVDAGFSQKTLRKRSDLKPAAIRGRF